MKPCKKSYLLTTRQHLNGPCHYWKRKFLAECACRVSMGNCDKPREVCLVFGTFGQFLVERGKARQIDQQQALQVLDLAEESGLVHTCNNSQDEFAVLCNCCSCCCTILRGLPDRSPANGSSRSSASN